MRPQQLTPGRPRGRCGAGVLRRRDERGSLFVVITVILVVVMLSSVLFLRIVGNEEIVAARQNTNGGVAGANAGLSDALFQLDQGNYGSNGVLCLNAVNLSDPSCNVTVSGTASPQLSGISYVAREIFSSALGGQRWVVQSIGNARTGFKGAVQETLNRNALFPFALFGVDGLAFHGNTTNNANFASYTPTTSTSSGTFTACSTTSSANPCLYIGSDKSLTCSGPSPAGVGALYYNTGSVGGSKVCGTPQSQNSNYTVATPSVPGNVVNQGCPNGGLLGSGYGYPTIGPGLWECTSEVYVSGTLSVSAAVTDTNPVLLYIMTGGAGGNFINITASSQINTSITYAQMKGGSGPPSTASLPDSELFQLYTDSTGSLTTNGTNGFVYGGIIDAPQATMINNGCQSYYFGASIINTYTCNGGPNLGIYYDSQLSSYYGPWQVSSYQQINPSAVAIP